ncbi:helix-turn-helix transcriptional regulator [uncultured Hyphomonas sp.]|uniref:helix-turn-helix domain-containing protein n=1 Tax=uncultured Hyphomonas sp. TaxID=225298 RepID=UPI002AAC1201|nr:helix-turn-helix transcriptional regulator [uncultured Hyphomonas sp.]
MNVENLPDLNPPQDLGDILDPSRPVLSLAVEKDGAHRVAAHQHDRGHIVCPRSGAYWIVTPEGTWLVPAGFALWIPPCVHHEIYSHGSVSARVLFIDPACSDQLTPNGGVVKVTPFLEALFDRVMTYGNEYEAGSPGARLAQVALDEFAQLEFASLFLPVAKEPRLARVMRLLIEAPGLDTGIAELAKEAGASERTLARLFRKETGMTFTQWKTNLTLLQSMERLEKGEAVADVAHDLGYSSPSSFVYMFRRRLGVPPGTFRNRSQ